MAAPAVPVVAAVLAEAPVVPAADAVVSAEVPAVPEGTTADPEAQAPVPAPDPLWAAAGTDHPGEAAAAAAVFFLFWA